jgi:hypothetical protein
VTKANHDQGCEKIITARSEICMNVRSFAS